jgi:hypothetical protein
MTTEEREATINVFARFSEEEALRIFGPLSGGDERSIKRVLAQRREETLEEFRQESLKLEKKEAESSLRDWMSVHSQEEKLTNVRAYARALFTVQYEEVITALKRHNKAIFVKWRHKLTWEEGLADLKKEKAWLELHRDKDEFVALCMEIDRDWRSKAQSEGVVVSHVAVPEDFESTKRWYRY